MNNLSIFRTEPNLLSFFDNCFTTFNSSFLSPIRNNVFELEDKYQIELIVPGFKKDEINIDINDSILTISSEVNDEKKEENNSYSRYEFKKQSFTKQYQIPKDVNNENIKASYENGILVIELIKEEKVQTKKTITIE